MRLTNLAAALLCLTASTPIHAAPEDSDWVRLSGDGIHPEQSL